VHTLLPHAMPDASLASIASLDPESVVEDGSLELLLQPTTASAPRTKKKREHMSVSLVTSRAFSKSCADPEKRRRDRNRRRFAVDGRRPDGRRRQTCAAAVCQPAHRENRNGGVAPRFTSSVCPSPPA
jgi:hypothetical protein